ncbi:hypothetical protein B0T24DRAFT_323486 [Lasiosphaeria ovina]|uniref:Uncharacterized protein n=1 Tax=Lasiosphaeria ovina TaxID=92902 RepID=A0AAE0K8K4_9PEZI|nr:hypothetical protein B0T24DRAFT_323486 [Lasiosphaeria ovina]
MRLRFGFRRVLGNAGETPCHSQGTKPGPVPPRLCRRPALMNKPPPRVSRTARLSAPKPAQVGAALYISYLVAGAVRGVNQTLCMGGETSFDMPSPLSAVFVIPSLAQILVRAGVSGGRKSKSGQVRLYHIGCAYSETRHQHPGNNLVSAPRRFLNSGTATGVITVGDRGWIWR